MLLFVYSNHFQGYSSFKSSFSENAMYLVKLTVILWEESSTFFHILKSSASRTPKWCESLGGSLENAESDSINLEWGKGEILVLTSSQVLAS